MRISPGKCPNQLSLSAASQNIKPTTVKSTPMLTSNLPRFSMVKPHYTAVLWHEYGRRRAGCQGLRRRRTPSSPGTSMHVGETIGPRSVVRLSAWCKTATMAGRFHVMGMRERDFRGEYISMPPLDPAPFIPGGAVHGAWTYPLFDAILRRRARRFPLGATMLGQE